MKNKGQLIKVEKRHIRAVDRKNYNSTNCPIVLAILEQTGNNIYIGSYFIEKRAIVTITDGYYLPRSVYRFVSRFDSQKSVKPFNFILKKL